ncbi:MAG TPA: 16S rRNA (cytosine(1402)-N(4))-methyltransferase RsmH [Acidimicrobiales bacterium]|nr:16S rRNA (cytosine(1402)-N(4))-methyltransferase RsmH [Acidimicrobiales bacterium]
MSQVFSHEPVMVDEVVAAFAPVGTGVVVDATLGGAGHAVALLEAHPGLRILGLDRDPQAVAAATERLRPFGGRAEVVLARFDRVEEVARAHARPGEAVVGALFDLGVSSPQLDQAARGFSYRLEGPLDMRMGPGESSPTAADLVNELPAPELARLFAANGEGRFARRIADAVVAARPLATTTELAEVVRNAIPAATRRTGGHPARRVFQALRIAVNEELDVLARALPGALALLTPGGRCAVVAYHSGEDRIVKALFADAVSGGCVCPPGLPCVCGAVPTGRLVFRGARKPGPVEIGRNHRAESARMRLIEKLSPAEAS